MSDTIDRLSAALDGRYRVERQLGEGGMATVYLAEDLRHHRRVAIKVLKPELAAALGAERFLAEIRTTANLQHPNILPLFDSGDAGGLVFYVMPHVDGESLKEKLDREGMLPIDEAVALTTEIADALDHAHQQGVVHRDIKPANIMIRDGRPLLADFGIALAADASDGTRLTETGLSIGTPAYMSPEQGIEGERIDGRSDIYSLGCVLYEMLAGDPPFTGTNALAVLVRKSTEAPPPLRTVRESIPESLERAVLRALAKVPADRFGSAAEFGSVLGAAGAVTSGALQRQPLDSAPPAHALRRSTALAAAAMAVAVGVWGVAQLGSGSGGSTASTALTSSNPEAQAAFELGEAHFVTYTNKESLDSAIASFERAIDLDPDFAMAYAKVSQAHTWLYHWGHDPREQRDARILQARARADQALELDSLLVEAHLAQALRRLVSGQDALPHYLRAIELDPDNAGAQLQVAYLHGEQGRWGSAVEAAERAISANPSDPQTLLGAAEIQLELRDFARARRLTERAIAVPGGASWRSHTLDARIALSASGDVSAAVAAVRDALDANSGIAWWSNRNATTAMVVSADEELRAVLLEAGPSPPIPGGNTADYYLAKADLFRVVDEESLTREYSDSALVILDSLAAGGLEGERAQFAANIHRSRALALAGLGREEEAVRAAEAARDLIPATSARYAPETLVFVARMHAILGHQDEAIDILEQLLARPSSLSPNQERIHPWWKSLRDNPRFQRLVGSN